MSKEKLLFLWSNLNHLPGWLNILDCLRKYDLTYIEGIKLLDLTDKDLKTLEEIDENAIEYEKEAREIYRTKTLPEVRKQEKEFIEEIKRENGEFIRSARLEYLNRQIEAITKRINEIEEEEGKAEKDDLPFWLRKTLLEIKGYERLKKKRMGLNFERHLVEQKITLKDEITPEMIKKAQQFPFEQLIPVNRKFFALCPFHKEKRPSFYIRNNFGYCFGCGWYGDTIKFLMDSKNMTFKEAVKALQ